MVLWEEFSMSKVGAMEEMHLIYQAFSNYLAEGETWDGFGVTDLTCTYRSFCQREPIGGMFLESVLEELIERIREGKPI